MSVRSVFLFFGLATQLVLAPAVRAQAPWPLPVEDPVLAALIEKALADNPDVAAARHGALAARERPVQARSLANPMVSLSYTNDGWSPSLGSMDGSNLALMVSQELPYPGKRGLRGDLASAEVAQALLQAERVKRSLAAAVKRSYYGLLLSRGLLDLIRDQEDNWKQIEGVARARYAVGQGAQQDVLRVQVEVTRIQQFRAEQEAEAEIRLAELNRLLARAPTAPLETSARLTLRPVQGDLQRFVEWATAISPEAGTALLEAEKGSVGINLAKREFKPDFSAQSAYMNRRGLPPMWQAGIGVSVPVYRKKLLAGVAEAEAQLRSTQSAIESIRLQLRFRTQERLTQLKTTEKIATLYGEGIVPQDRMSVDAALASYQTGKAPFIAVLEAITTLYNDRVTHLRLLATHEQTLASLEEASLDESTSMVTGTGGAGPNMSGSGASQGASGGMGNR
jgi:outer membrane protein, heavy metal efflux system